ncbi:MAG: hypothetical protein ACXW25_06045 [Rhodospirillales bacterium]
MIAFPEAAHRPAQTPFDVRAEMLERLGLEVRTLRIQYAQVYAELCRLVPTPALRRNIPKITEAVELYFAALLQLTEAKLDSPVVPLDRKR